MPSNPSGPSGMKDPHLCYTPHGNDNPLSSAYWHDGPCPTGGKEVPGNPSVNDLVPDPLKKLATSVSDFIGLITTVDVLKGFFLLILAGVTLIVGIVFIKGGSIANAAEKAV